MISVRNGEVYVLLLLLALVVVVLAYILIRKDSASAKPFLYASRQPLDQQVRMEALFENAPIAYHEIDCRGMILRVNRKECNLRFSGIADMVGKHCWDLAPPEERERYQEEIQKKLRGEIPLLPVRRRLIRPNRQEITIEAHESLLRGRDGEIQGMLTASLDITESQKQQEEVFRTTSELKALFQALPDMLLRLDATGRVLEVKEGGLTEAFAAADALLGRRLAETLLPEEGLKITQALQRLNKSQSMTLAEFSTIVKGNREIYEARFCPNYRNESIAVVRRITERREGEVRLEQYAQELEQKNGELAVALANAREATEMKSRFLANMSHEIRTPMNGILGMTEFLLNTNQTDEQREYSVAVKQSADSLLTLINDILDISKIEAGKLRLEPIPFDLAMMVEELAASFAVRARAKGLEFTCAATDDVPQFMVGDPGRVRQVLNNLIGNAIKFTERGKVTVFTELINETEQTYFLRFMVQDTGIGIAPRDKEKLFQSFVQGDSSTTRKYGGTGLGLAISKQLVEMMGGEIGFNSDRGRGTTFYFTAVFEKAPAVIPQEEELPVTPKPTRELQEVPVLLFATRAPAAEAFLKLLESWKCVPHLVESSLDLSAKLMDSASNGKPYRIVLFDGDLEGADARETAKRMRGDVLFRETAFILLTTTPFQGGKSLLREAGFAASVGKPIRASQLYETMVETLRAKEEVPAAEPVAPSPSPLASARLAKEKPSVLLAEDNAINQRIAVRLLQKLGVQADVVSNGREAVAAFDRTVYDLILMDCQMPEMDGFEATAEIRKREGSDRRIPICALTANAMVGDREKCISAGMDDYVSKPVALGDLQAALNRLLQKSEYDPENKKEEAMVASAD